MKRGRETWWSFLRSFYRLWGFLIFLGLLVFTFRSVVLPFVLAAFIAYLLAPIIRRLELKLGRGGAVAASYIVLLAAMAGFMGLMLPALAHDVTRLRETAPDAIERVNQEWLPRASTWLDESFGTLVAQAEQDEGAEAPPSLKVELLDDGSYKVDLSEVQLEVREGPDGSFLIGAPHDKKDGFGDALKKLVAAKTDEFTSWLGHAVQAAVKGTFSFLTGLLVTFMVAAFMLVDIARIRDFTRLMVPPDYRDDFDNIVTGIDTGMSGVIRGQLTICAINGALTYVGLLIFGVKYSLLLGLLAGAFSLVPIFGTIISSLPIMVIALVSDEGAGLAPYKALAMLLWIAGIHLIEANFLNPKILGESAKIHPVVVIFALLAGESMYGLTGALLAVPVASMVQTIFLYSRKRLDGRWGAVEEEAEAEADAGKGGLEPPDESSPLTTS